MKEPLKFVNIFFLKGDRLIFIGMLMVIFMLFTSQMLLPRILSSSGLMLEIYQQKKLLVFTVNKLPTEKESEWDLEGPAGGLHLVYAPPEGFYVRSASCPDHICVHTGLINQASQSIVCIPNEIIIRLVADGKGEGDALDGGLR